MNSPLDELCALVAQVGIENASKLAARFEKWLTEGGTRTVDADTHERILIGFAFMNWGLANGVWSSLDNTRLRRDLMASSKNAIVLRTSSTLRKGQSPEAIALLASLIDEHFQRFIKVFIGRMNEIEASGVSPDANAACLIAIEWIQDALGIPDARMDRFVPLFLAESIDFAEIESVAGQLTRAAADRQKKGILRRFVGWEPL